MHTAENAATKPLQCFSGMSTRSPFITERRRPTLAAFPKKTGFRKHRSNIDIHASLAVVTFVLFPVYSLPFATSCPKVDDSSQSVYYSIRCSEVDMLCFRSVMLVRSFAANKISGRRHQPLLHAMRNIFVFVLVLPPIELICKMCCPTSAIHSTVVLEYAMWSSLEVKFHLTRSLVALEGWSSVRDCTNRKHCPSHEIWSYKRDGRW